MALSWLIGPDLFGTTIRTWMLLLGQTHGLLRLTLCSEGFKCYLGFLDDSQIIIQLLNHQMVLWLSSTAK